MNPNEEKLEQFVEDSVMFAAVRAILFSRCDLNSLSLDIPTAELAPRAAAYLQAREILEAGFRELSKYKKSTSASERETNPNGV